MVEPDRPQITIQYGIACWIAKATNIHSECVILIAIPLHERLCKSPSILPYKYFAYRFTFSYWPMLIACLTSITFMFGIKMAVQCLVFILVTHEGCCWILDQANDCPEMSVVFFSLCRQILGLKNEQRNDSDSFQLVYLITL